MEVWVMCRMLLNESLLGMTHSSLYRGNMTLFQALRIVSIIFLCGG
jgi:hypothetical protein